MTPLELLLYIIKLLLAPAGLYALLRPPLIFYSIKGRIIFILSKHQNLICAKAGIRESRKDTIDNDLRELIGRLNILQNSFGFRLYQKIHRLRLPNKEEMTEVIRSLRGIAHSLGDKENKNSEEIQRITNILRVKLL